MRAACLLILLMCVGCDTTTDRAPPWGTTEIIEQAVAPHVKGKIAETRVLAWHSEGYDEPPRAKVECVLVWVALQPGAPGNYALVRTIRNPAEGAKWSPEFIGNGEPPVRYFQSAPTSEEVVAFAKPWFGPARAGARLYDSSILQHSWRRSTGENPTVSYK